MLAYLLLFGAVYIMEQPASAQAGDSARTIVLNEFTVSGTEPRQFRHRVRTQNVHHVFRPGERGAGAAPDSSFLMTAFSRLSERTVRLDRIGLRLQSWDTATLAVTLIVFQALDDDTSYTVIPLNPAGLRGTRLDLSLRDAGILLHPGPFYIGYSFRPRDLTRPLRYRVYSRESERGAFLDIINGEIFFRPSAVFPYNYPFVLTYTEL